MIFIVGAIVDYAYYGEKDGSNVIGPNVRPADDSSLWRDPGEIESSQPVRDPSSGSIETFARDGISYHTRQFRTSVTNRYTYNVRNLTDDTLDAAFGVELKEGSTDEFMPWADMGERYVWIRQRVYDATTKQLVRTIIYTGRQSISTQPTFNAGVVSVGFSVEVEPNALSSYEKNASINP